MKFYTLDTEFTFGKFQGNTLRQVIDIQPSYLDWCSLNLDHFYMSNEVIEEIKGVIPDFKLSDEGVAKLNDKYEVWENEQENDYDDYDDYHERESFGQYAGSYAQDVEGLSDDFINDVLDGDPDAYWNID
ncbi:hypothetical protein [Sphingobacterium mizutaii]|uniref:exodeoxyribonuclease X C-terminal domain-containing protein n=1 Tax=Sphingobacterium mizutaii TaxID=1010 RepID=UPI003D9A0375